MRLKISILLFVAYTLSAQQFSRIETGPVVTDGGDSRAVNWVDYDNDGDLDLFITNGPRNGQNNFFYENNGDGTFTKISELAITKDESPSDGSTWADFNNDGYPDLFVANWWGENNLLYLNNGDKTFTLLSDTSSSDKGFSESASWADINGDAFVDLFVANSSGDLDNFIYINTTAENFNRNSGFPLADYGGSSRHMDFADYDNDGDLDLFIPNENNENNFLYQNNGDGSFTKITDGNIVNNSASSFGSSWGDFDNDGDFDLFVANWSNQNNYLYKNNGDGTFERITEGIIVNDKGFSIGTAWADVDNDGDLDLYVANAFSPAETNNFLYLNNGDGTFSKDTSVISTEKGWSYGASFGDFNRDGYLDLAAAKCFNANENNALFLNKGGSNNWLTIKLTGTVSNRSAIGAVVRLKATINGKETWQMRQVSGQNGYCGQNLELHFGLGNAAQVDSIFIQWPSGQIEDFSGISVNQVLEITETIPEGFLRPHFKADKRLGFEKENIQFTDLSVSSESNPINSWKWDFNNDGNINSEETNPWVQYDSLGIFDVTLTVGNGIDEKSKTFEDYLTILRVPGTPIINEYFPAKLDTIILKREEISFMASANDTSDYPINYSWFLAGDLKSTDSIYNYRASAFFVPRIDSVLLVVSNGFKQSEILWQVDVRNEITTIDTENNTKPSKLKLYENYPNPFNPETTISFDIAQPGLVEIAVFNILGEKVSILLNEEKKPGHYSINFNADNISSGLYFYRLSAGNHIFQKKMILLK